MQKSAIKELRSRIPSNKKKSRWKLWTLLFLLVILLGGAIYAVHLPQYRIQNVVINGAVMTDEASAKQITTDMIAGDYLYVLPKNFYWLYPKSAIKTKIETLPSVMDAALALDHTGTLTVTLTERRQAYLWCGADSASCFYMDKDGLVFAPAPQFEGNVFLKWSGFVDETNPVGKMYLPQADMDNLTGFIASLKTLGLEPTAVRGVARDEVHVTLASGTDLIVSLDSPLADVIKNLSILMQSDDFNKASGGVAKTSYIDLRFGSKAFWK